MEVNPLPGNSGYAPRNALNADQLKRAITARSQVRGDTEPVRRWLLNHFYRHLVSNFEPARRIHTLQDTAVVQGETPLPPWLTRYFDNLEGAANHTAGTPLVWVDPDDPKVLEQEALLVEFLGSRQGTALEGKLDRINCPQALQQWQKEHAQMAVRAEQGWRKSQPEALRVAVACADHTWVELVPQCPLLRSEMAFESYVMRHCLGQFANRKALVGGYGERYAQAVEQGHMRVFSLRDAQNQPHITVSITLQPNGALTVDQVKGKQNRPPVERYYQPLLALLNAVDTDEHTPADCIAVAIVRTQAGWLRLEDVTEPSAQTRLVALYPQLFSRLPAPSALVEWLVAARQPELLEQVTPQAASVRYAARHVLNATRAPGLSDEHHYRTEDVQWVDMSSAQAADILHWQTRTR